MPGTAVASLVALTPEAEHALGGVRELRMTGFPIRFGRERRTFDPDAPVAENLRTGASTQLNDVYLFELAGSSSLHISGAHFAIEQEGDRFFVVDRGSACGTIVAGQRIGGNRAGGYTELHDGDEIVVGTSRSRFIFRFDLGPHESVSAVDEPAATV